MLTDIKSLPNYSTWKNSILDQAGYKSLSPLEQLKYLSLLGHLAASSHNTQPWRFKIDQTAAEIKIFIDGNYILSASDVDGRQTVISIGCAIQNIEYGAAYFGQDTKIKIINENKEDFKPSNAKNKLIPVASITVVAAENPVQPSYDLKTLFKRKIMRAEYDEKRTLSPELGETIKGYEKDNLKIHLVTDRLRRLMIGEFQAQADNYVINSNKFSRELGSWLLPNGTDSFIGMPGFGFGLKDDEAERLHKGLLGEQPLYPEDGLKFATGGKIGIEKSPAICFITAADDSIADWIATGKILQQILIVATEHGLSTAIHAGISEVAMINKLFSMTFLHSTQKIMTLVRIGYLKRESDQERPHSPRWPLDKVLI
ncbi:MAG TPA: hypothetical protein VJH75_00745 [Patescibacteria group bacterium]|nr:hypothetical protein [Patescibacteria group bacterium]